MPAFWPAAAPGNWLAAGCAAIFGLLIGSFLNVVIHRLPKMMQREHDNYLAEESGLPPPHADRYDLLLPRSQCPGCAQPLATRHNIPVFSYLFLRGRCARCGIRISLRYPIVELLAAGLSALLVWRFGSGAAGLATLPFGYCLLAMAWIDAETGLLPDDLTLPLLWCGLLVNVGNLIVPLSDAVLGAAAGYLSLWLIFQLYRLFTGKEGMGYGDFKLLAALGAWLGAGMLPLILLLSAISGMIAGLLLQATHRRQPGMLLPFGPHLALGGMIALLYGPTMLHAYLNWAFPS